MTIMPPQGGSILLATDPGLVQELTVGDVIRRAAALSPEVTALVEAIPGGGRSWTYARLLADAEAVARALLGHFAPGEKVAVWAPNIPEWILLQLGAGLAGLILVTVNPALRNEEARHVLAQSGAHGLFHVGEYRGFDVGAAVSGPRPALPALRERHPDVHHLCPDRGVPRHHHDPAGRQPGRPRRDPRAAAASRRRQDHRRRPNDGGWLHTGDLAAMDARGYLTIRGRLKEMIIRGGENIYPREIEEVLARHPAVAQVAVVGVPDEKWGEQVAAAVIPTAGATLRAAELAEYGKAHLAPHKVPSVWTFVDAFPVTGSGKIRKNVLRDRLASDRRESQPPA